MQNRRAETYIQAETHGACLKYKRRGPDSNEFRTPPPNQLEDNVLNLIGVVKIMSFISSMS